MRDVAAFVVVVDGGVAQPVFDALAPLAVLVADTDALAQGVGLFDDAPLAVVFGFELQAARRVAVAAQRVGVGGIGGELPMNDYWQACSQQCKPCFLGNACNGGWQDGAGHFNKRSKFEGGKLALGPRKYWKVCYGFGSELMARNRLVKHPAGRLLQSQNALSLVPVIEHSIFVQGAIPYFYFIPLFSIHKFSVSAPVRTFFANQEIIWLKESRKFNRLDKLNRIQEINFFQKAPTPSAQFSPLFSIKPSISASRHTAS